MKPEEDEAEDSVFLSGFDQIEKRHAARETSTKRRNLAVVAAGIACGVFLAIVFIAVTASYVKKLGGGTTYTCPSDASEYDFSFFVLGDWGRQGNANQMRAAKVMSEVGDCMNADIVLSTGDNFYESGLTGPEDPKFQQSFTDVYTSAGLQVEWYGVLGNHDVTIPSNQKYEFTGAQEASNDLRWHCQNGTRALTGEEQGNGLVDILLIDTNPFVQTGPEAEQSRATIRREIDAALKSFKSPWRFVVGHHPVYSYGQHCTAAGHKSDCLAMAWLAPVLDAGNVTAYFCGHEHDLQHIRQPGSAVDYVVSGAGSDVRPGEFGDPLERSPLLHYSADDQGFVVVQATAARLSVHFYVASQPGPSYSFARTA